LESSGTSSYEAAIGAVALHVDRPIADSPDLVLSSNTSPKTGSVFGTEVWDTPEITYKIQALR
jgi:hypothetical protein